MKRIIPLIAVGLCFTHVQAQEISDALRYGQDNINGSARYRAMGGAFGALGGDLSALNNNPAGSAIFSTSQVGVTLTSYNVRNKSNYFGTSTSESDNAFDLNHAGGVYVLENEDTKSDWKKFAFAINYDNISNLDNTRFAAGTSPNSIGDYFTAFANMNGGVPLNLIQNYYYDELNYPDAQAYLGYQAYVINPVEDTPSNSAYVSNVPAGGNYYQEYSYATTGYNGRANFNMSAQYKDNLYFGLSLNSHFTDFRMSSSFYESNANNPNDGLQRMRFNNDLYTYGAGFSFQLGMIAKITNEWRAGLAYESPTWYLLNDELSQSISSVRAEDGENFSAVVDPNVTIVYETYKLQTPGKWTGSLAYIFGKSGLLSVDYSLKDYRNTTFRPESDFSGANRLMENVLDFAGELRIGGEYRIKNISLRAGYRNEQSPYKNGSTIGDLNAFSGGLGYSFGSTRVDISYTHARRDYNQSMFSTGFTNAPSIQEQSNNVSLGVVFDL
jgi:hypothetical protein